MAAIIVMWIGLCLLWYWLIKSKPVDSKFFNVIGCWFLFIILWMIYENKNNVVERLDFLAVVMVFFVPTVCFILGFFSKKVGD